MYAPHETYPQGQSPPFGFQFLPCSVISWHVNSDICDLKGSRSVVADVGRSSRGKLRLSLLSPSSPNTSEFKHPESTRSTMLVRPSSLALLSTWLWLPLTFAMWPFPPKRFKGNALLGAGSLGLDTDGRVVALGDFNGDQLCVQYDHPLHCSRALAWGFSLDMVSIGSDQQTLTVHLWDHGEDYRVAFSHPSFVTFSN